MEDTQQKPLPNKHIASWDLVKADIDLRDKHGEAHYGTRLQPFNGRKQLRDVYEELLDAVVYLRTLLYEEEGK